MNRNLENLYKHLPVRGQNLLISLYGYKLFRTRYQKHYYNFLNIYKNKDYSNLEQEKEIQRRELVNLLAYAVENSKFYKKFYDGIDISKIKTVEDLKLLPVLEKEVLRANIEDVYTISSDQAISSFTGGTTGKSLKVYFTKENFQERMAYLDAFKARVGIDTFKTKKATFSGREFINSAAAAKNNIFWRYNSIYKQRLYSTFDLLDKNLPYYIQDLNRFKPDTINGFVSAIFTLAKFIEDNNITIEFIPKAIFTTSETLLSVHREVVERTFKCRIYNQYASGEGAPFITECVKGNLHYDIDTGVIEQYETEYGLEMLVTSFTTYGTPLIRYRIGDLVTFKNGSCSCGSSHPLVERIEGRKVDYLFSSIRGHVSLSHLADVIKGLPNCIKNMQFVQNEINDIEINLVVDRNIYTIEHENSIIKEMRFRFGEKASIKINLVDDIPREASGKFSLIKNKMKKTL